MMKALKITVAAVAAAILAGCSSMTPADYIERQNEYNPRISKANNIAMIGEINKELIPDAKLPEGVKPSSQTLNDVAINTGLNALGGFSLTRGLGFSLALGLFSPGTERDPFVLAFLPVEKYPTVKEAQEAVSYVYLDAFTKALEAQGFKRTYAMKVHESYKQWWAFGNFQGNADIGCNETGDKKCQFSVLTKNPEGVKTEPMPMPVWLNADGKLYWHLTGRVWLGLIADTELWTKHSKLNFDRFWVDFARQMPDHVYIFNGVRRLYNSEQRYSTPAVLTNREIFYFVRPSKN